MNIHDIIFIQFRSAYNYSTECKKYKLLSLVTSIVYKGMNTYIVMVNKSIILSIDLYYVYLLMNSVKFITL